ncbi:LexA-binding, inner membrane-associated putative hydrolase [Mariprofundus ferrinatatus]|uniref:LexA-binding, inner membrane-associated putative hydrolase n=1 Tax=Mariprofundus ferrinatatus TaxID=1921087 RepID=A0A2K8L0S4_9PROT|nr:metal-dependent hydrolase [Mariprofundus ferrinatatus]ATX80910.1 LexA-binding, inner membrane-associated putative hydrolase [Mariprofundus ferrinatatus]
MANFRTHLTVAAAGSLAATAVVMQTSHTDHMEALLLFLLGLHAGILPDIDSDHSIPAQLLFTILSFVTAIAVVFLYYDKLLIVPLLFAAGVAALAVRFLLCPLFAATTEHRGLFHSLPAALLFGMATFSAGIHLFAWQISFAWLAAGFVSGGYLLHLLLDEFYSVDFTGAVLKESFGSALTLFSGKAWLSYLLLYAAVGIGAMQLPLPGQLLPM